MEQRPRPPARWWQRNRIILTVAFALAIFNTATLLSSPWAAGLLQDLATYADLTLATVT